MEFEYDVEQRKLNLANENIQMVLTKYNKELLNLNDKDKRILQLYYYLKKLDTFKNMTPKGHYWDAKREQYLRMGIEKIETLGKKIFSAANNIEEIKINVEKYMDNSDLEKMINKLSVDIKSAYKKHCDYVYTVLPISGIKELEQSRHRENQYLNSINNGVFATSTINSIEKYIARANVGGMIAGRNKITYPSNPFSHIGEDELTLIKPVSVYLSNVDLYEPQFDYDVDQNGIPHLIYDGEWIAPHEKVACIEKQATYIPSSFLDKYRLFYQENDKEIQITSTEKTYK